MTSSKHCVYSEGEYSNTFTLLCLYKVDSVDCLRVSTGLGGVGICWLCERIICGTLVATVCTTVRLGLVDSALCQMSTKTRPGTRGRSITYGCTSLHRGCFNSAWSLSSAFSKSIRRWGFGSRRVAVCHELAESLAPC